VQHASKGKRRAQSAVRHIGERSHEASQQGHLHGHPAVLHISSASSPQGVERQARETSSFLAGACNPGEQDLFAGTNVNSAANSYEPLDLFRFSSANTPDTSSAKGGHFSIDNGQHNLHTFNGTSGDYGDWAVAQGPDAFNTSGTPGVVATKHGALPEYDLQTMDATGWDHLA
jgi:hypothetical protein